MEDKSLKDTTDQEMMVGYVKQLESENKRLKQELKDNKQPRYIANNDNIWVFEIVAIALVIVCAVHLFSYMWPGSYDTGRFYISHKMVDYNPPKPMSNDECREHKRRSTNAYSSCRKPAGDLGNCYVIVKEIKNGTDDNMSGCILNKDEAYKEANVFADEWKKLEAKGKENNE